MIKLEVSEAGETPAIGASLVVVFTTLLIPEMLPKKSTDLMAKKYCVAELSPVTVNISEVPAGDAAGGLATAVAASKLAAVIAEVE